MTPLLELRALRDGARRPLALEALAEVDDARVRRIVGEEWIARAWQEHLAVGAFSLLASELAEDGCLPVTLWLVTRAAADEVRHADVCNHVAAALLGEAAVPIRRRGLPKVPAHEGATREARVLLHVVEMGCLSETFTGIYFTEALAHITHPSMRAVFESLLEDEIDHGRLGWAYLAERARDERTAGLAEALPDMLDRVVGRVVADARRLQDADEPALLSLGHLARSTAATIFARGLRDVVLPGFEELRVDLGPARARIAERGWLELA